MRQKIFTLLAGMVLGMVIVSGGHAAANTVLTATPSSQMFYIDGQKHHLSGRPAGRAGGVYH